MSILLKAKAPRSEGLPTLKLKMEGLKARGITPALKVILIGDNPASVIYTEHKKRYIESLGGACHIVKMNRTTGKDDLLKSIQDISKDPLVHGLLVQLPLPQGPLDAFDLGPVLPPSKDVDGLHPINLYKLITGDSSALVPCTPKGILQLLQYYSIGIKSKNVVVIGRSMIVGKPLASLFTNYDATVTLCHSQTKHLEDITKGADIIISAVGKEHFLDKKYIGSNAPVVIDVGINRNVVQGTLCGDVHFDEVSPLASAITPVPGGVGPMTIYALAQNLLQAVENAEGIL